MLHKITVFTALLLTAVWGGQAQSTDTLSAEVLFSQLDTGRIPTEVLMEKVLPAGPDFYFNDGENPEAPALDAFAVLDNFSLLREGAVGDTVVPEILTLLDSAHQHLIKKESYPVVIADFDYNLIDSLALVDSLLTLNDSVLVDGPNFSNNPYQTHRFLNAAVLDSIYINTASFVFDQNFYFSNTGMPDSLEINFGDGQGFREVNMGTAISPDYGEYTPNYNGQKATLSVRVKKNGHWATTSFKVQIIQCNTSLAVPTPSDAPWPNGDDFRHGNITTPSFDNSPKVEGNAYIHFRANPATGEENFFKRPVIIIEGFETGDYDPNKAANFRMGDLGWCQLWGSPFGILNESPLKKSPQLFNQLHNDGYDIIMLDFKDSKRSLINNAALVRELIKRVNQYKVGDAEPNIVIGASAGGLMSRYALAYMEDHGEDHCTRSWFSLDAPHNGAYISLGTQYLLEFLATNTIQKVSAAQIMRQALNSKAARELLLYNIFQSNKGYYPTNKKGLPADLVDAVSQEHLNFRQTIDNMGYPKDLKSYGIASGSRIKKDQGFAKGDQLYKLNSSFSGWNTKPLGELAYVEGNLDLDYWAGGNNWMKGKISYKAKSGWLTLLGLGWITVKKDKDINTYRNPGNIQPLDRVPGGIRELAREIQTTVANASLSGFNFNITTNTFYHRHQSFVPSVSALDLNTTDYFFDIQAAIDANNLITPFDGVYIPDDNTLHVEITDGTVTSMGDNIDFTLTKIKSTAPVSSTQLTNVYNYGSAIQDQITHTHVNYGGRLHVYGNFADSRTATIPPTGNTHKYYIGSFCNRDKLIVHQNGELILGDASVGNKANVFVRDGGALEIRNGGTLRVQNDSKLIIEEGANFTFEDGAQIEFNGPNAELVIEGKLTVGNNATFTYSGSGKLIFDQDIPWIPGSGPDLTDYMDVGSNTEFDISGSDPTKVKLVVKKPLYLRDASGSSFDEVRLHNIGVEDHKLIFVYGKALITGVHFNEHVTDPNQKGSLRIWDDNSNRIISNCDFYQGDPAILAHSFGSSNPITIKDCKFDDNWIGVKLDGGAFEITNSTFKNSIVAPITGDGMSGESIIGNCIFTGKVGNNGTTSYLTGQEGSLLSVYNTSFENYQNILTLKGMDIRAECSDFKNSNIGLDVDEGTIYLDDGAANNFIALAQKSIMLYGETSRCGLFLKDGDNRFNSSSIYSSSPPAYLDIDVCSNWQTVLAPNGEIDADRNFFNTNSRSGGGNFFSINTTACTSNNIGTSVYKPNANQSNSCNTNVIEDQHPARASLESVGSGGGTVGLPGEAGPMDLKAATLQALDSLSLYENPGNDLWSLNRLTHLQTTTVTAPDGNTDYIRNIGYSVMFDALANAYENEQLMHSEGEGGAKPAEFTSVTQIIDNRINDLDPMDSADHNAYFSEHLAKTHTYRTGGYYSDALNLLGGSSSWTFNNTQSQRASYWECICEAEDGYYSGTLPQEEFAYEVENCNVQHAGYNYKRSPEQVSSDHSDEEFSIELYPQPVKDWLRLQMSFLDGENVKIEITDISGRVVLEQKAEWAGNYQSLDLSSLQKGSYLLHLESRRNLNHTFKILKVD